MQFPIFIQKDKRSDYGVIIPDLPGCFSAGETLEQAIQNAHEAIECHLEGLFIDNEPVPLKKHLEQHLEDDPELQGCILALVEIDISMLSGKTTRINVSLPERFLAQIDEFTQQQGGNRSGFLLDAAMSYMAQHQSPKYVHSVREEGTKYLVKKTKNVARRK
jgi:predicted RNase H-like HicB family nuclease